jgi:hypothetical protein
MEFSLFEVKDGSKSVKVVLLLILFPLILFIIIYTYYYIFKLINSKCSGCGKRPKLSLRKWLWEIWKIGAMPWKKVRVFCRRCQQKVEYRQGKFVKFAKKIISRS